ncbi:MAG: WD40 repeat domain-containing protein, partial [Gemmatimonadetes bacterium]|nr:WD40 repeat domain-containing protein [Gemmatimonadota bacterium]
GNLYVGTGDQGRIYKIDSSGKSSLFFDTVELDVVSLAVDKDGNVYAGTSPDGMIYVIKPSGEGKPFTDTPENYIWSMVFDDRGDLYAGTGEKGRVYRFDRSGNAEVIYDSQETNILSLVWDDANERLILGGDGNGLLMALDRDGDAQVIYDSPRDEVGAVFLAKDGAIYFSSAGDRDSKDPDAKKKDKKKALLYRVDPGGAVELFWASDAEFIFALVMRENGNLLVGTGSPGTLVELTPDGESTIWKELAESQLLKFHAWAGDFVFGTGNQGHVYRVGPDRASEGEYTSETMDAANVARWGNLRWWGETEGKADVVFETRSGNTEEPDDTWSEWEEIRDEDRGGKVRSPAARFLQWKAKLTGDDESGPQVERVRVAYKEHNLAPRVHSVTVSGADETYYEGPSDQRPETLHQVLPDGTRVEYYPARYRNGGPAVADDLWTNSIRTARWEATDANGDLLHYDVYCRAAGESSWLLLDEDLDLPYYSWDSRKLTDGDYRLRIVAKDREQNPEGTALTGERIGEPFTVDNTPPVIDGLSAARDGDRIRVEAGGEDRTSPLRRAAYSFDAQTWNAVEPVDAIFDSWEEEFAFEVRETGSMKSSVLFFRVSDEAGNVARGKVSIR